MDNKYFLYIDILGFSNLVKNEIDKVEELNKAIASLNVHDHYAFQTIVFPDTILVYNSVDPKSNHDHNYLVMYLCEFVQDLIHRLVGYEIYFRAIITNGNFNHYKLNEIDFYFGEALIEAYESEKDIKCTGLFIDKDCPNDIFYQANYDSNYDFVFVIQGLNNLEDTYNGKFPIPDIVAEDTDELWFAGPEMLYLEDIYSKTNHPNDDVKKKFQNTWNLYENRYTRTTAHLVKNNFDLTTVNPKFDWQKLYNRYPETYEWASEKEEI